MSGQTPKSRAGPTAGTVTRLQSLRSCYEDHAVRPSPSTGAPSGEAPQGQGQKPHSSHQTCSRARWRINPTQSAGDSHAVSSLFCPVETRHCYGVSTRGGGEEARPGWGGLSRVGGPLGAERAGHPRSPSVSPPPDPPQKPCCCRTRRFAPAEWPLTPRWAPPPSGHTPVEGTARGGSRSLFSSAPVVPSENDP